MKTIKYLSDFYDFQYGKGNNNPDNGGQYPVYGSNGIIGWYDKYNSEDAPVIGHIGANCGSVVWASGKHYVTYNGVICKIKSRVNSRFAYYTLLNSHLETRTRGAAQPFISYDLLNRVAVYAPVIETQNKIASILSTYDTLIENNNRRIRLLEQMAENLYKEWFVRFRFPGHEKVEMENGLPKGWKRTKLIEECQTSSGGTPSRSKSEYYINGTIPWIKTGELQDNILINTEEYITEDAVKHSSAKIFPKGTLLMAMYGVNIGKLGISEIEATCNQACCVFTPKQIDYKYYLYHYFKSIREYLLSISFGAAQQNLSQELIKAIKVIFPNESINTNFVRKIEPLYKKISFLQKQNTLLTRQRDLLLPRLMSGKLEVKP
ncbi:restriction endonuclease subunit S [Prevotella intermedia]|uniref:restriction endonuclease subunit S n=1 Tax=Prevotella intermedia TaxID=28131 RepID=UPI000DC1DF44|nr:restriction endonuclease subunit S [Prevotella intermedia]AWX07959.1 restriction endonuclease subunit S [Prevotella intermedia]